ncbi:hypothetical protein OSB04_027780 [Centaurea solstitialis]|uniref:Uncharacterized protein n=1 Tax=Centaurea solstitialis TaxID=347529 RepID=A0AA38SE94_9ASTR|nr:hypothetical protein OSB04_027780 [Centaurea solstitialis]
MYGLSTRYGLVSNADSTNSQTLYRLSSRVGDKRTRTADIRRRLDPGCKDMFGKVRIPYPFGIGAKCSVDQYHICHF